MDPIQILLTVLTILGGITSIIFGFLAFRRNYKEDTRKEGGQEQKIDHLIRQIEVLTIKVDKMSNKVEILNDRLIKAEVVLDNHVKDKHVHVQRGKINADIGNY